MNCTQCGNKLRGYFQFNVCSECYSKNVTEAQRKLLAAAAKEGKE